MFNLNKLKDMTTEWKRLYFGKLWFWHLNRAWKAPLRMMGLVK